MAGACLLILLPVPAATVIPALQVIIERRSATVRGSDFWIAPGNGPVGVPDALPFFSYLLDPSDELWNHEVEEADAIHAGFGFDPRGGIGVGAMCRGWESDMVLAELAIELLTSQQGCVQFGGLLAPSLEPDAWRRWSSTQSFHERARQLAEALGPYPGRLQTLTLDGEPSAHVVDRDFLRFWTTHAAFHIPN